MNKTSKKAYIKKRDLFEDKVLEDLVAGTVADDVVIRRKHYNAGLVGVKNLQKEFPRRYKRKVNNTTLGKKEIFYHFDLYERYCTATTFFFRFSPEFKRQFFN